MVSLDYSLGIQIINFVLLIFILNRLLYKPLLGMIDKRKQKFADSEAEIRRLQETVEQQMAAYEEKLRQAKAAAVEEKNEIIRRGAEEARAITDAVRAEIPEADGTVPGPDGARNRRGQKDTDQSVSETVH